jgi:hypothetical protein
MNTPAEDLMAVVALVVLLIAYFVPTIIAFTRKVKNESAIMTLNFLAGWTLIGWIGALIWAMIADRKEE